MDTTDGRSSSTPTLLAGRSPVLGMTLLAALLALAILVRFHDLTDLPLDFHAARQLRAAMIARGMYYEHLSGVPGWQVHAAVSQWHGEGVIEPQVFERLVAMTYDLAGGEHLWIPRIYSSLFWVLGGLGLYFLARDLSNSDGALVATAVYLFLPYAVIASRSFQPDPLMVALIVLSLWTQARWLHRPTVGRAILAGLVSGLAIYIKAIAVFPVLGSFTGALLLGRGLRNSLRDPQAWLIAGLGLLPTLAFYIDGLYVRRYLAGIFDERFYPSLWTEPYFYIRWAIKVDGVVGVGPTIAGLLGLFLAPNRPARGLLVGLWAGYVAAGLTFAYHYSSHDYYHLSLIPIVALSLAPLAAVLLGELAMAVRGSVLLRLAIAGALVAGLGLKVWESRIVLSMTDYRPEAAMWQSLGEKLRGKATIALTQDYGYRLAYWGWLYVAQWPSIGDLHARALSGAQTPDFAELFEGAAGGRDYFLITDLGQLHVQPELEQHLSQHYPVWDQGESYLIYDLTKPLDAHQ